MIIKIQSMLISQIEMDGKLKILCMETNVKDCKGSHAHMGGQ